MGISHTSVYLDILKFFAGKHIEEWPHYASCQITAHLANGIPVRRKHLVSLPVLHPNHWIMLFFDIHFHGEITELTFSGEIERLVIVASLYFYSTKKLNMTNEFLISSYLSCSNNGSTDPRLKCQQNAQSQNKALLEHQTLHQYLNLSEAENLLLPEISKHFCSWFGNI